MIAHTTATKLRHAWTALPAIFRWNGGTLVIVGFVIAAVHTMSNGPTASRADLTPPTPAVETFSPLTQVKLFKAPPATQPVGRNLFSLDWNRNIRDATTQAVVPDDPGFWNDVASPLTTKHSGGGVR